LTEQVKYYKKLYTKTPGNDELFDPELNNILNTEVDKLSDDQREICEGKRILCECALKGMENNKSPGSDGISVEFYKLFWHDIKQYF